MSAQSAEQRFRSITIIIKHLRIAGLWLEEGTGWDKPKPDKNHLNPAFKSDTQMLESLCSMLVRNPGDVVAALIAVHRSGAQLVVAESSPCVLATNSKSMSLKHEHVSRRFQALGIAIKPPCNHPEVLRDVYFCTAGATIDLSVLVYNHPGDASITALSMHVTGLLV